MCVSVEEVTVGFTEQEYTFFEDDQNATVTIGTSFAPSTSFSVDIFSGKVLLYAYNYNMYVCVLFIIGLSLNEKYSWFAILSEQVL